MNTRSLRLLASTSLIGLGLAAAPLSAEFSLDQPILKMAQAKCCFTAGTSILMADGSARPIEAIQIGDQVMGGNGRANRVVGIERPTLGARRLYGLNGGVPFVTAEHPFMTSEGWKSIDPALTAAESPSLVVEHLCLGDSLLVLRPAGALAVSGTLALARETSLEPVVLRELRSFEAPPLTPLFNLLLGGDHAYFANGYLVHNKDNGGEGGSGGGEGGEGGESGSGSSGSGSSGSGSGEGGESGNSGSGGESGESGESSESGESGSSGSSGSGKSGSGKSGSNKSSSGNSGSGGKAFLEGFEQVGPDLSKDEEAAAISKGWK